MDEETKKYIDELKAEIIQFYDEKLDHKVNQITAVMLKIQVDQHTKNDVTIKSLELTQQMITNLEKLLELYKKTN